MPESIPHTTRHLFEFPNGKIVVKRRDEVALAYLRECAKDGWTPWNKKEVYKDEFLWTMV